MTWNLHICGMYRLGDIVSGQFVPQREYLPQVSLRAHTEIISTVSRTTLTQTFVNPTQDTIRELRYTFPLYDGVSVVGFVCTINDDRVIRGFVQERAEARQTYQKAVDRGETAGLLEQLPDASDVFTTTVGNVPADATLQVEITYLGELKHDAQVDGIRFTIPTSIAPRYGSFPGRFLESDTVANHNGGTHIVVDIEMPEGSIIKSVQSPSHPIQVTLGNTSVGAASGADPSLQKASATQALWTTDLGEDFVLQVVATNTGNPIALLETHPTLPNHRALMASLVPKFSLPPSRPEIVFLCDRSGSMADKIPDLKRALHLFLKSLPVGVKFNICSFGSRHSFLFPDGSRTYDASALDEATRHVDNFAADFGGTDIYHPMEKVIKKRYTDMDLEVFLLTDGEIWDQAALFNLLNSEIAASNGRFRVFSLGIGRDVSHALIEGVARAGNGFGQVVGENENMNKKVVRMLKASLMPHIDDYTLEVKYSKEATANTETETDDEFELVEKVVDCLAIDVQEPEKEEEAPTKKPISLFDEAAELDVEMTDTSSPAADKYSHVPPVPEPKILQAPFLIPSLSPFSRTTVYLLLGPDTVQQQPKSVVLRGTSPVGPVELEISVTVLPETSETIHQLAARSAVKELEEGRGWIYHAKDAKDTDNPLLKDKYPGRFQDMVEREAVRLGVTYQVGGKWCSFVAVEEKQEANERAASSKDKKHQSESVNLASTTRKRSFDQNDTSAQHVQQRTRLQRLQARQLQLAQQVQQSQAAQQQQLLLLQQHQKRQQLQLQQQQQQQQQSQQQQFGIPAQFYQQRNVRQRAPQPVPSLFASLNPTTSAFVQTHKSPQPPPPPPAAAPTPDARPRRRVPSMLARKSTPGPPPRRQLASKACRRSVPSTAGVVPPVAKGSDSGEEEEEEDDNDEEEEEEENVEKKDSAIKPDPATLSPAERLAALVALQTFEGAWRWEESLLRLLGLQDEEKVVAAATTAQLGGASDRLATALVVAFLEVRLEDREEEWEMLADKAKDWLSGELAWGGEKLTVYRYCEEAKKLLVE